MNDLDFDDEAEVDEHKDPTRYWGKYRGMVIDNADPELRGRIMAVVTSVQGLTPLTWAMPCVPFAGLQAGIYAVPPVGSKVWIEFEHGDPNLPIWVGGFWGSMVEVPLAANVFDPKIPPGQNLVMQTMGQHQVLISDATPKPVLAGIPASIPPGTGGVVIRSPLGASIVVNDEGIFINNGLGASINLIGTAVFINTDAIVALK
jgi:Type VI secretion system/phage-baseplate injector OB domain